ncbi:MAG: hypothetical protein HONBIEJF_01216 [Fimbriimonadaceae bacterium]|nr:hypothetical protein [Fimbriimonadaceae bacterium]
MSQILLEPQIQDPSIGVGRWKVVIHNNSTNTFEEVILALIEATGCTLEEAQIETWEAHHYGRADVHFDSERKCSDAAKVIARIGVQTDVVPEWND